MLPGSAIAALLILPTALGSLHSLSLSLVSRVSPLDGAVGCDFRQFIPRMGRESSKRLSAATMSLHDSIHWGTGERHARRLVIHTDWRVAIADRTHQ
ncbi:hypothetical protein [Phormidium sp. CCY1219]|uniref:hypothetical protein n=1 Tax=Phormidium sp. CCY1219 TaxID=2886104 RepID=UPI002D1EDCF7|nr:hypothetical protein [Phormidium sp. CCY1219]MEB3827108.1 hypothetical protein [Phormidium sp. CCY1219]